MPDIYDDPRLPLDSLRSSLGTYRDLAESSRLQEKVYEEMAEDARRRTQQYESIADRIDLTLRGRIDALVRQEPPAWRVTTMCGVATGSGLPCSRRVDHEGARCWQHEASKGASGRCSACHGTGNAADKDYGMSCEPCGGTGRTGAGASTRAEPSDG